MLFSSFLPPKKSERSFCQEVSGAFKRVCDTKSHLDFRNTGGATNKDDLVNLALLNGSVLDDLLNGLDSALEGLVVDVLETGTGDLGVEVLAVEEGVDLNGGLGTVGEGTLGTLASSTETTEGTGVVGDVLKKESAFCRNLEINFQIQEVIQTFLLLRWNSFLKCSRRLVSKSCPPR